MATRSLLPAPGAPRILAVATLVNTLGNGLFYTASALYLTRIVGFSVTRAGVGLTLAGVVGLLANVPAGRLAETYGPREVLSVTTLLCAVFMAGYGLIHSFPVFLVIACGELVSSNASNAVRNGLIATAVDPEARVRTRAYLRSVTNLGIGVGSALAGVAIHLDTRDAYLTLIYADAATFVATAVVVTRLPHVAPLPKIVGEGPQLVAIRDKPYLVIVAMNSLLCVHNGLLEVAVPLWIVRHTNAPRLMVAAVFVLNTAMCVVFQIRASRGVDDIPAAAKVLRRCGVLLFVSCALYAAASGRSASVAIVLLLLAEFAHVCGELFQAAGSWSYGYELALDELQGQYQGLFSMSYAVSSMLAPVIVTTVAVGWGWPGWLLIGASFAALGAGMGPAGRWAAAHRPAPLEFTDPRS